MGKLIPVSEIYGPVVQGEGPLTGRPTIFLRLGGCDYHCSWCDSLYAVEAKYQGEWERLSVEQIVERLNECFPDGWTGMKHVTISGGNPAIHNLGSLIEALILDGWQSAIETQGTRYSTWMVMLDHVVVSPKPPSSGNTTEYGKNSVLQRFEENYQDYWETLAFKVVIFDVADFEYARAVHQAHKYVPFWVQVGTAVGEDSPEDLIRKVIQLQEWVMRTPDMFDVHVGLQTHVLIHGHRRGI